MAGSWDILGCFRLEFYRLTADSLSAGLPQQVVTAGSSSKAATCLKPADSWCGRDTNISNFINIPPKIEMQIISKYKFTRSDIWHEILHIKNSQP